MSAVVHLVYESNFGRPLTAAKITSRKVLLEVARTAIREAYERAEVVGEMDMFVGEVQWEEAARLERVLKKLIPELESSGGDCD
jgi:hypothetical protein